MTRFITGALVSLVFIFLTVLAERFGWRIWILEFESLFRGLSFLFAMWAAHVIDFRRE